MAIFFVAGCSAAPVGSVNGAGDATGTAVIRVSGTEGVRYFGSYGVLEGHLERVEETLGSGPTSQELPVAERGTDYDVVSATFQKLAPEGYLEVEILWDGEVVQQGTTEAEEGLVMLNYYPSTGGTTGPASTEGPVEF